MSFAAQAWWLFLIAVSALNGAAWLFAARAY
jgi:hypothetical protein